MSERVNMPPELEAAFPELRLHYETLVALADERALADDLAADLAAGLVAIDLTRQYVGEEVLPAIEGWSWFDWVQRADAALARYREARQR